jgi:hypothetical protein
MFFVRAADSSTAILASQPFHSAIQHTSPVNGGSGWICPPYTLPATTIGGVNGDPSYVCVAAAGRN